MKTNVFQFNMETGDHSNGASPKSQTSRGNSSRTNSAIKKTILCMAISALLILTGSLNAQTKEITGVVEDDQGAPIEYVSVRIKGSTDYKTDVMTDVNGKFSIKAKPSDVLEVSYFDHESKEISVGDQTFIKVKMEDAGLYKEVVQMPESTEKEKELKQKAKRDYELARKYRFDDEDYEEALKYYRKSAEQGHVQAQCDLGNIYYYRGCDVDKDYKEALKWFRKSAEKGDTEAQCMLGEMYENGHGVSPNLKKAIEWYRKAAKQEYKPAIKILKRLGESY